MILKPLYAFKYYPYRGLKLAKLDPLKGNIIGYVDDYREYSQALRENPKLKKTYDSSKPSDRKKLLESLEHLHEYQYSHTAMIHEAMKLGVLREDIERLISQKDKLIPKKYTNEPINLDNIPSRTVVTESIPYVGKTERIMKMIGTEKPEYLSLEERKKRAKKSKLKRKIKKCKCKK